MTEIGSRQDLDEAVEAFKDNPNMHNQSVLERAMRVYQCNVTAVEPVMAPHNHGNIGIVFPRDCQTCKAQSFFSGRRLD